MKARRHPLTQLGVEDMPGCLIGIDLCIDIVTTSGITFASQALIRMRDAKSLLHGLMEREEELLRQRGERKDGPAAPPSFWMAKTLQAFGTPSLSDLFDAEEIADLEPNEVRSNRWEGSRWAVRVPIAGGDGARHDDEIRIFIHEQDAADLCVRARNAAKQVVAAALPPKAEPPAAAPKAKPATRPPAPAAEGNADVFTPERLELFRKQWPNRDIKADQVLANFNALPGKPCASVAGLYVKAKQLGMSRLAASKDAEPADKGDFSTEDMNEARDMLARGVDGRGLHEWFGGELAFWSDFATAYRAKKAAA